jgi:ABC-type multidrug transport system ATPase subunit
MSAESVLSVSGLTVRYGSRTVLEDVSLEVPRGSVFALLGRNGMGKSSLVRCALGQQKPSAGVARLFGTDAWVSRARAMERIGVVPEEPDAPPEMTADDLVRFCRPLYPVWDGTLAGNLLDRLEVPRRTPFEKLSKGQKGAVMLALALAPAPDLLILDDPTLGLDVVARRALYDEIIGALADRGTTAFVTTHDLAGVEGIVDRVGILRGGRLVVTEALESLKERYRRIRCATTDARPFSWAPFEVVQPVERDWGRQAVATNFSEERLAAFEAGATDVEVGALDLEEIFLSVVAPTGEGARA